MKTKIAIAMAILITGMSAASAQQSMRLDEVGKPESSGILDVSKLFGEPKGTLFLFDVQNHGIDDQERFNEESRIIDEDLKEGGQLLFLRKKVQHAGYYGEHDDD